jgi:hypothetical protein
MAAQRFNKAGNRLATTGNELADRGDKDELAGSL